VKRLATLAALPLLALCCLLPVESACPPKGGCPAAGLTEPVPVWRVAKRALRSVVRVEVPGGWGSGFVVDGRGFLVTNHHVASGGVREVVFQDGTRLRAQVVHSDRGADLALLRVELPPGAGPLPLAAAPPEPGEDVLCLGCPLELNYSFTVGRGTVGGIRIHLGHRGVLQHSAPSGPGSSGGPLLNLRGEVVGVHFAGDRRVAGLGFALSLADLRAFLAAQPARAGRASEGRLT
jgi:S1-C subfamily serine protease